MTGSDSAPEPLGDRPASSQETLRQALAFLLPPLGTFRPEVFLTFGSGLGDAVSGIEIVQAFEFRDVPGLASPAVTGHAGRLLFGTWSGKRVMACQGRLHRYEGHSWDRIVLPVRLAARLGARIALFTNSSGGIDPNLVAGTIVIVDDHVNFMGSNPLTGLFGPEDASPFIDMTDGYSKRLRSLLDTAAARLGRRLPHGVYLGVDGPNYETPAEIRAFRSLGADVVGMSTVGEILAARYEGLECAALSCVSNQAAGVSGRAIRHDEVLAEGRAAAQELRELLEQLLKLL